MNSNYVAEIQSTCIPNEQHVSGNMCPSTFIYPDICYSSGIHVSGRHVSWCKRGIWVIVKNWLVTILLASRVTDLLVTLQFGPSIATVWNGSYCGLAIYAHKVDNYRYFVFITVLSFKFNFYSATHMQSAVYAVMRRLSVCPSVRLSHWCIVSKQQSSSLALNCWIIA